MSISPADDGLAIPEVGAWSKRKYHFLGRYLSAFTVAMRPHWSQLHYIDLFAGAGFARVRGTGELVLGSPLLAATTATPFTQLHLCDRDPKNTSALAARLAKLDFATSPRILTGDANEMVDELLEPIPRRDALCMSFADPFGLHLDFAAVERIATLKGDLVLLFADNMDALRNWAAYYKANPASSLDRFMGEPG